MENTLLHEIKETEGVIKNFSVDEGIVDKIRSDIESYGLCVLTGEGSSRIFPAKNIIHQLQMLGSGINVFTQGGVQLMDCNLADTVVLGASNSGRTKELIELIKGKTTGSTYGITATSGSILTEVTDKSIVLNCGKEHSVAATKSVMEQGLVYQSIFNIYLGGILTSESLGLLGNDISGVIDCTIDQEILNMFDTDGTIYFAGKNNGVAEEITLKTNEIIKKRSAYLEGTYVLHGIEEVIQANDVVVLIDPDNSMIEKFKTIIIEGTEASVLCISTQDFGIRHSIVLDIESQEMLHGYVYLLFGQILLSKIADSLGVDGSVAEKARKVGNEYVG